MKKFIGILLVCVMLVGVMPLTVGAGGGGGTVFSSSWATITISDTMDIAVADYVDVQVSVRSVFSTDMPDKIMIITALYRGAEFVTINNMRIVRDYGSHAFDTSERVDLFGDNIGYTIKVFVWAYDMEAIEGGRFEYSIVEPPPGRGMEAEPFLISTIEHLEWINGYTARLNSFHYRLENDIVAPYNFMIEWFTGVFDGNGHTITVDIYRLNDWSVGLFGVIVDLFGDGTGGVVKNLTVAGNIVGDRSVGGVAWWNNGTIKNVSVTANVTGDQIVGGIAGENHGVIINSYVVGDVTGRSRVGGIAGENRFGTITNTYFIGDVSGNLDVGGIVGLNEGGIVSNSVALSENLSGYEYFTIEFWRDTMGWDFDTVWRWNDETRLPTLRRQ